MFLLVAGLNHKTAPLELREKVSLNHGQLAEHLRELSECVDQGAILSTCNRTEVYAVVEEPHVGARALRHFLTQTGDLLPEDLAPHLYLYSQRDAVRHLFSVASGIDSMVLGESEVLGQVRGALESAEIIGTSGTELSRFLRQAISVGREVRDKTGINRNRVSVSSVGVDLAKSQFGGTLDSRRILLISAGEAGKLTAKALTDCGNPDVIVTSRTYNKAVSLADQLGGKAMPFSQLEEALANADIVISSTGAPHFVLHHDMVEQIMQQRANAPLLLIDIAVPRDIDPMVRQIKGVSLHDIGDLEAVIQDNLKEREKELDKATAIIDSETTRFVSWWDSLQVAPMINMMRQRAETVRRAELEKTLAKLKTISDADREAIDVMTRSIVNKMLHHPTMALKEASSDQDRLDVMRCLFDV